MNSNVKIVIEYIDGGRATWTANESEFFAMLKHDEDLWFENDYVEGFNKNHEVVDLKLNKLTNKIESVKFVQRDRYNKW
jgi:hypothetical protein